MTQQEERAQPGDALQPEPAPVDVTGTEAQALRQPKRRAPKKPQAEVLAITPSVAPVAAPLPGEPPEITVIVPVSTVDGRVREVVDALSAELERLGRSFEFVIVFDGVRGPAWAEAEALARERPGRLLPMALQQAFGESMCLSAGLQRARGRLIVTSPQYVQIDPYELGPMLAAIDAGADLVSPWRHPRVDPVLNRLQSAMFNQVMRWMLHAQFHDLNCTFRAMRREVLRDVPIHGDMYRFLPAIASRQGFKVVELRVRHLKEWGGKGFFGLGVYGRRALDVVGVVFLSKFTHKPLRFFGTVGAVFLMLGAILCLVPTIQAILDPAGNAVLTRSVFQLGVLLFVLGVQVIGFGLVGEIIIYTQAQNLREYRVEKVWEAPDEPRDGDGGSARER